MGIRRILHGLRDRRCARLQAGRAGQGSLRAVGDGSFMMLNSEIPTAIQENAKITVVVFDNAAFGCINNLQMGNGIGARWATEMRHRNEETASWTASTATRTSARLAKATGMKAFYARPRMSSARLSRMPRRRPAPASSTQRSLPKTMAEGYESWWPHRRCFHLEVRRGQGSASAHRRPPRRGENVLRQSNIG